MSLTVADDNRLSSRSGCRLRTVAKCVPILREVRKHLSSECDAANPCIH